MLVSLGQAVLELTADDAKLSDDLKNAESMTESALAGVGAVAGTLATAAFTAAAAGITAVVAGIGLSISEAMGAQEIAAQTAAVIKSTGGAAGLTADEISDLAGSLSTLTRYEDDTIQAGENMLLTFTNIGKDIFPDVTEIMLDMSTAMGTDLKSSAIQLGKALNDPMQGMTALTRVGVAFTEEQKNEVKALQESGDIVGAQAIILAELQKEFGGSAVAAGQTFGGQLDILKNSIGNVAETIGTAFLPVLQSLFDTYIRPNLPMLQALAEQAAAFIQSLLTGDLAGAGEQFAPLLDAVGELGSAFAESMPSIREAIDNVMDTISREFGANGPNVIESLANTIKTLAEIWSEHGETIIGVVTLMFDILVATTSSAITLVTGIIEVGVRLIKGIMDGWSALLRGDFEGFKNNISETWSDIFNIIRGIVENIIDSILRLLRIDPASLREAGENIINGIRRGIDDAVGGMLDAAREAAEGVMNTIRDILGIHSPSDFGLDVGANIMRAMGAGMAENSWAPAAAMERAVGDMAGSTTKTFFPIGNLSIGGGDGMQQARDFLAEAGGIAQTMEAAGFFPDLL